MKITKKILENLILEEMKTILTETGGGLSGAMAGEAGSSGPVETERTIMIQAIATIKGTDPELAAEVQKIYDRLLDKGHV